MKLRALLFSPWPAFVLLQLVFLFLHEPWRDEAQPWLIARDASPGWWVELDSEGSPGLWYALLWPLAKLGLPFGSMRVLHVALASAALAVFLLRAPFSTLEKWLFSFGFFVAFEYAVVARSYVLVLLLLFLAAAHWPRRHERPLVHGALLLLLANVTAHGALMALALGALFAWETFRRGAGVRAWVGVALPFAGVALAALSMVPGDDLAEWRTRSNFEWAQPHFVEAARGVLRALFPWPPEGDWWWGRTLSETLPPERVVLWGAVAYAASCLPLVRAPRVLLVYVAGSLALLAVFYLKHEVSGQMRHHGMLFALFVACLWLARLEAPPRRRIARWVVPLALAVQVAAAAPAFANDAAKPWAGGQGAAEWIRANGLDREERVLLAFYPAFLAAPVLVHLDEVERAYFPQVEAYGSYVRWTKADSEGFHTDRETIVRRVEEEAARVGAERVLLLLSFHHSSPTFDERWTRRASFDSLAPGDAVFVYEFTWSVGEGGRAGGGDGGDVALPWGWASEGGGLTPSGMQTNTSSAVSSHR